MLELQLWRKTFLLQRHYDGFLKKGRVRSRNPGAVAAIGDAADIKTVGKLWLVLGIIFLVGIVAWSVKFLQSH